MKILVTGAKGFIAKNLIFELKNRGFSDILEYDIDTNNEKLSIYCKDADFVYHLAGVNRPIETSEFMRGNYEFTLCLLDNLKRYNNSCPILLSSSIQASLDNPYGKSKKAGEELLFQYHAETGSKVMVYRFPNIFGKWCKPNYNSAVATFCYNIAHDLPIIVNDSNTIMNLVYIDDVINELINALNGKPNIDNTFYAVPISYTLKLGDVVNLLYSFKKSRNDHYIPDLSDPFIKKLFSTYSSYLPENDFSYELTMNKDSRGSFTEFIKTSDKGQVSINISRPGVIKGNHWHHTKLEKFLVVKGHGVIRLRKIDSDKILEYYVSGEKLEVVDIPVGYTHSIENIGESDLVTVMWANEPFSPEKPDTYLLGV